MPGNPHAVLLSLPPLGLTFFLPLLQQSLGLDGMIQIVYLWLSFQQTLVLSVLSTALCHHPLQKEPSRVCKVARWVKALVAKPNNLSSTPGPTQWKARTNSHTLSSDLHSHRSHLVPHIHGKINKCKAILIFFKDASPTKLTAALIYRHSHTYEGGNWMGTSCSFTQTPTVALRLLIQASCSFYGHGIPVPSAVGSLSLVLVGKLQQRPLPVLFCWFLVSPHTHPHITHIVNNRS